MLPPGEGTPVRDDRGMNSNTLAVVLLMVVASTCTGAVYFFSLTHAHGEAPPTLVFEKIDDPQASDDLAFRVVNASENVTWTKVSVAIDGKGLTYDDILSNPYRFCLSLEGGTCLSDSRFASTPQVVAVGQIIRIHAPNAETKPVTVTYAPLQAVVWTSETPDSATPG